MVRGGVKTLLSFRNYKKMIKKELEIRLNRTPSKQEINWCFWDYLKFKFKYNGSLDVDYFGTQMYLKSDFVRKDSFATFIRFPWRDKINDMSYRNVFDDKRLLYR